MNFRLLVLFLCTLSLAAQQTPTENPQAKPAGSVSATTRLLNAKTIFLKKAAGGDTAFDMVSNAIVGWPRYTVVDSLDKADLLIEVSSPEEQKKKEGTSVRGDGGELRKAPDTSPSYGSSDVKVLVRDAHTRAVLWAGSERVKEAFRDSKTEENLIDATQKVLQKLHDRVEPAAPAQ
jgi:hypothetical protein